MERDPMEMALSTHVVLDNVLKHLKVRDVLNCREVSKFWNKGASSVLRRRSTMIKSIFDEKDLMKLEECMRQSSDFPLAGLKFLTPGKFCYGGAMEFFRRYGDRFTRLRLDANFTSRLQDLAPFINELPCLSILEVYPPKYGCLGFEWPNSGNGKILELPSVRTIRLLSPSCNEVNEEILREIVTAASPSVQIECLDAKPGIVRALESAGRLRAISVMKFYKADHFVRNGWRTETDQLLSYESPSLIKLEFHGFGGLSMTGLLKILCSSQDTLKELHLNEPWLSEDSWEEFPVFTKLTRLSVSKGFWHGPLFDGRLGYKFPALKELNLDMRTKVGASPSDGLFIVPCVSTIHIIGYIDEGEIRKLARSFPNVIDIQLDYEFYKGNLKSQGNPFKIWNLRHFKHLEKLMIWNVSVKQPSKTNHTMDSFLTGIPVEICKKLLQQKQLNPNSPVKEVSRVNPCILQLENLKELIVCVKPGRGYDLPKGTLYMTMVSVWYALEMMPNLQAKFVYEDHRDKSVLEAAFKNVEQSVRLEWFSN